MSAAWMIYLQLGQSIGFMSSSSSSSSPALVSSKAALFDADGFVGLPILRPWASAPKWQAKSTHTYWFCSIRSQSEVAPLSLMSKPQGLLAFQGAQSTKAWSCQSYQPCPTQDELLFQLGIWSLFFMNQWSIGVLVCSRSSRQPFVSRSFVMMRCLCHLPLTNLSRFFSHPHEKISIDPIFERKLTPPLFEL